MKHLKHYRTEDRHGLAPHGGLTALTEFTEDGVQVGVAICSEKDNYCKKTGRELATTRFKNKKTVISNKEIVDLLKEVNPSVIRLASTILARKLI